MCSSDLGGVDGFRFDAAKHMDPSSLHKLLSFINSTNNNRAWNDLDVIDNNDTNASMYTPTAMVTDFLLGDSLKQAFAFWQITQQPAGTHPWVSSDPG